MGIMVVYKYSSISDAFHAVQEISTKKGAEVSFVKDNYAEPIDIDALDVSFLPFEYSLAPEAISSGEELMLHCKDHQAKAVFLSFPLTESIVFRLILFKVGILAISAVSKTRICVDVPEDVEEILEKYGFQKTGTLY